ncbi:hypothetical protein [Streptomyces purpurogeneiscleroticus]|uniref:hypothetical protein n=1 Tax=Streptomyces purpurogeneiscleroticus TaxID=68259 RepID=UPI001CBAEA7E|nr:hypothetical protein [Streptomyces purpurogeneiscleroticus]MBZ4014460.1 hypothetical protein [Streptomyces purpurogeneiscleroticus]
MTRIEELLSRTLLVRERTMPRDFVPPATLPPGDNFADRAPEPAPASSTAAEDLRALCETLVTHTPTRAVADFVTDQVPGPRSALVLACVLQLTDTDDGARFWWQYAAGAGQTAAAYCLYLHHLALGEDDAANWWLHQADDAPAPSAEPLAQEHPSTSPVPCPPPTLQIANASITTVLHLLRNLGKHTARTRSAAVTELMDYIPTAVATGYLYQPDMELPTPGPDFANRVSGLLTAAADVDAPRATPSRPHLRKRTTCEPQPSSSKHSQTAHSQ